MEQKKCWFENAGVDIKEKLKLQENQEIFAFERIFYADETPSILVLNKIPRNYFKKIPSNKELEKPIYKIIWDYCEKEIAHSIYEFVPLKAQKKKLRFFL